MTKNDEGGFGRWPAAGTVRGRNSALRALCQVVHCKFSVRNNVRSYTSLGVTRSKENNSMMANRTAGEQIRGSELFSCTLRFDNQARVHLTGFGSRTKLQVQHLVTL